MIHLSGESSIIVDYKNFKSAPKSISYEILRELWQNPEIERPSIVVNLIGDYSGTISEVIKQNIITLLETLNNVHGWLVVAGLKTIEFIGNLLNKEARNVVDELDHVLVCIAVAPFGILEDEARMRLLGVLFKILKNFKDFWSFNKVLMKISNIFIKTFIDIT